MWKLKNHVKNIRQFSIKDNKIGVLTKNGEIQYHHIETVKNAPLLTIQAEEYGKLNLIQNFLIWNNHYGRMSIFSVLNGNKINIEGSASSKIHFFNENKGGFYALKKINKQYIITVKYEEKENSFKEVWNINKSPYLFFANPEDGYSIISNYGRELTKINSHDGSIIWKTEFDGNIFENFTWIFGVCDNKILL